MRRFGWGQIIGKGSNRQLRQVGGLIAIVLVAGAAIFETAASWWRGSGPPSVVEGRARVIDGDSLKIGRHEIRMVGIDAPEGRQTCTRNGQSYRCGDVARDRLRRLAGGNIRCEVERRDQHERLLATCFAGTTNLNQALVVEGLAVRFGNRYRDEEGQARREKRGLWAGEFERPRDWRRRNRR